MTEDEAGEQFTRGMGVLQSGSREDLEALSREIETFPHGVDPFLQRHWIRNAIDSGSKRSVEWMLEQGVDLSFDDEEGFTVLHSAIDRERDDKYDILKALLLAGAPVNAHGTADWTPAHMAAARDDVEALRVLIEHGADLTLRTRIDYYATPLEEAEGLGKVKSVKFLTELARKADKA